MTTTRDSDGLAAIGQSAIASILCLVQALKCDYARLQELRDERDEDDPQAWTEAYPEEAAELAQLESEAAAGDVNYPCEDEDTARERIEEDVLEIQVRSDWVTQGESMEPAEYLLLLTTGGPAIRIVGELTEGEPSSARLEVQDWGTPWTEHITTGDEHDALLAYAQVFYFGE